MVFVELGSGDSIVVGDEIVVRFYSFLGSSGIWFCRSYFFGFFRAVLR